MRPRAMVSPAGLTMFAFDPRREPSAVSLMPKHTDIKGSIIRRNEYFQPATRRRRVGLIVRPAEGLGSRTSPALRNRPRK
ncbi:hypothetical protein MHY1_p00145 (plasmid) [Methylovirgula sp. HY1]|nr:hypothetical protein MHY1_p00145 [Methylovirgula sp. HY1]